MPPILSTLFNTSLIALIVGVVYMEFTQWRGRRIGTSVLLIGMALGVYLFVSSDTVESKGATDEVIGVSFSYLSMLLGMIAEYGYARSEGGRRKFKINMELLMPIFASPIVFIPVLTLGADMSTGGAFTKSKLMVYLVAFQNGFFWKNFFEERRQRAMDNMPTAVHRLQNRPIEQGGEGVLSNK